MKKTLIVTSILFALFCVLILSELIKAGIIYLTYTNQITFLFNGILLKANFILPKNHTLFSDALIFLSPLITTLFYIEFSAIIMSKVFNNNIRTGVIVYQIINIGYMVILIILNAISILVNNFINTDWSYFIQISKYSYTKSLLITFLLILIIFTYINFAANRIKKYVTFIKS